MRELIGKYNSAKIFTDNIEDEAVNQVEDMLNQEFMADSKIRIMPDCHSGKGCVIGTTMTITDKVVSNLVGVDIGCGMEVIELGNGEINLEKLDNYIRKNIPHGFSIYEHRQYDYMEQLNEIRCMREIKKSAKEFNRAIGTLGGGNHFIEVNQGIDSKYLVIHSGSRNLGLQVANYYQNKAYEYHNGLNEEFENEKALLIKSFKEQGKRDKIQDALKKLKQKYKRENSLDKDICYLEGSLMADYLHDMKIVQEFASLNRKVMATKIVRECLNDIIFNRFETIHNYIDMKNMILRKGAISAQNGEKVLIPINMRDGSLICIGKGNPDWNYSAPHGAGRLMSRTKAKEILSMDKFRESMNGIYTTSVCEETLDESAFAYKPMEEIIENIKDTVDIVEIIKPIYNFKSDK